MTKLQTLFLLCSGENKRFHLCTRLILQGGKNKLPIKTNKIARNDIKYQIQHVNLQYKI